MHAYQTIELGRRVKMDGWLNEWMEIGNKVLELSPFSSDHTKTNKKH